MAVALLGAEGTGNRCAPEILVSGLRRRLLGPFSSPRQDSCA